MGANKNQIFWGEGVAFLDGKEIFEIQELTMNFGVDLLEAQKGDGGGDIIIPTRQIITARAGFLGLNSATLAIMTGATSQTGTQKRIRGESATASGSPPSFTLANTPIANTMRVTPVGTNKQPFIQVSTSPAVGEYTVSGAVVTFNASETETDFSVDYIYSDGAAGETLQFGPSSLPSSFELRGSLRTQEQFSNVKGDIVVVAAKCDRTTEFSIGGQIGQIATPGFDFNIRIDAAGDLNIYLP